MILKFEANCPLSGKPYTGNTNSSVARPSQVGRLPRGSEEDNEEN